MRCPKCGKMLDLQTTACPVCKTRIPADRHTAPSRFTSPSQPTSTQFIPPQLAINRFMPPLHNKFYPTYGTPTDVSYAPNYTNNVYNNSYNAGH